VLQVGARAWHKGGWLGMLRHPPHACVRAGCLQHALALASQGPATQISPTYALQPRPCARPPDRAQDFRPGPHRRGPGRAPQVVGGHLIKLGRCWAGCSGLVRSVGLDFCTLLAPCLLEREPARLKQRTLRRAPPQVGPAGGGVLPAGRQGARARRSGVGGCGCPTLDCPSSQEKELSSAPPTNHPTTNHTTTNHPTTNPPTP
jgi:hypothetical protein